MRTHRSASSCIFVFHLLFAVPSLVAPAAQAGIVLRQITSGATSGISNIAISADSASYITYVDQEGANLWGTGLGLAKVSKTGSFQNHCAPLLTMPAGDISGQAYPVYTTQAGIVLFHHRGLDNGASFHESFSLVFAQPSSCDMPYEAEVLAPSCTNTDNWHSAIRLSSGAYALAATSCLGTGTNQNDRNNLYFSTWSYNGTPVAAQRTIVNSTWVRAGQLAMVGGAGIVHLVYVDWRSGRDVFYYQKLDHSGNVLVAEKTVVRGGTVGGLRIDLAVRADGTLHLVWAENRTGRNQLFETRLSQNGDSLMAARQVTTSPGEALNPRIKVDSQGFTHLVWSDTRTGKSRVYYRANCCDDDRLLVPETLISDPGLDTRIPDMDVDGRSRARVVWTYGTGVVHGDVYHAMVDLIGPVLDVDEAPAAAPEAHVSPNPFVNTVQLSYRLMRPGSTQVTVHDAAGRLLERLESGWRDAGDHRIEWNGRDARGAELPAGIYFMRIDSGGAVRQIRVAKVR